MLLSAWISGLGLGSMYGLMALGFYVTYAVSGTVNFAQGSAMMLGAVLTFAFAQTLGWPMLASALLALCLCALYGLLGLGLGLSWGLLRTINLAHFAFAFLSAYICWQLSVVAKWDPLLTLVCVVPLMFALGAGLHWLTERFRLTPFSSLLLTFGCMGIVESVMQTIWTADPRKLESHYAELKFRLGPLYLPVPEVLTLVLAISISFA